MLRRRGVVLSLLVLAAGLLGAPAASAAPVTVTNGSQFTDTSGALVHAHGGGVLKVGAYYYWFGENRNADDTFKAVSVYRSADLKTWEHRNDVLTQSSAAELGRAKIERPKVIYNSSTGQYVMWMHKENGDDYAEARAAVATSSTVDGNYTYRGSFRPLGVHMSRDLTLFQDDDGTAYMASAARENADLNVYRLTADYTGIGALVQTLWPGSYREAPAMFKRNGVYFMVTSAATGWQPNQQKYATATSVAGTWSGLANLGDSTGYGSQAAYVLPLQGSSATSYLFMGDRWAGAWNRPVVESRYVWLPLSFPSATTVSLSWYPQVTIDPATGVVTGSGTGSAYETLVARHSGKCADIPGSSRGDGVQLTQYSCNNGWNQHWSVLDLGNGYATLIARHSGKCLDVADASTADGAAVAQWACNGGTNQQWQAQAVGGGYVRWVARHSGKCLDVVSGSTADGAAVKQYPCTAVANQQWLRKAA
ncbi:RICIN domain-containing protein [Amycolatopsis vancoresmycina]|uniref:RICIN domain-containing protein n=1 Tax=Amycolatopsis vancoresmycina TaxID=208444 RepID=UPI0003A966C2|nr:RICIN domain-containing protein [Amycolatopsis vancoresmycina]